MSSPASTGPAGAHFEAQVGAHYLLTMLVGAEPRGLPGTTIDRVEFQRASEGYSLDDVVVHACDSQGNLAVLEIQVKRGLTFAPSDTGFRKVVGQIAESSRRPEFTTSRHELAVAVARSSNKIDGAYQEVLYYSRRLRSFETFFDRIRRSGSANDDMRRFVETFRSDLTADGAPNDDEAVWRLLSRFQILSFDYTAQGSACDGWDKERAVKALHVDDVRRAGDFRKLLVELAIETASSGGDLDRIRLVERLQEGSFRLAGRRNYASTRAALAEKTRHNLDAIRDQFGNVSLLRADLVDAVRVARAKGRYVEIRGDGGVGKSALLKHVAEQLSTEAPIIVLSPRSTTGGGWTRMRAEIGFDGTARDLLFDMASSGGATLFLDGIDYFTEQQRPTVEDLVREAARVPGFSVVVTARRDFGIEEPNWLPEDALDQLGRAEPVLVGELNTSEVDELRTVAPELHGLLAESHPARSVVRNLFRLSRLAERPGDGRTPRTEVDMAEHWWKSADGSRDETHRERARVLKNLAEQTLAQREPMETASLSPSSLDALVWSQTLHDLGGDCMMFHHDVLRDWAVGNLLYFHPENQALLPLHHAAPPSLFRGLELAARMVLEGRHNDGTGWREMLDDVSREGAHRSWRRAVLLAPVRSEIDTDLLVRVSDLLLDRRGRTLGELVRTVMAVDGRPLAEFMADVPPLPNDVYVPTGPSWVRLIRWTLTLGENLPAAVIPDVARLYVGWAAPGGGMVRKIRMFLWLMSRGRVDRSLDVTQATAQYDGLFVAHGEQIRESILKRLHRWLSEIEAARYPNDLRDLRPPFGGALDGEQIDSLESFLRTAFLTFCDQTPSLASEYARSLLARGRQAQAAKLSVIRFPGMLAHVASEDLAHLAIAALIPHEEKEGDHWLRHPPFLSVVHQYSPPSPDHGPFIDLLTHKSEVGLKLVRRIVDYAISYYTQVRSGGTNVVILPFPGGDRSFRWLQTYAWARASQSRDFCVTSALMALSKWADRRVESGDSVDEVVADVLGPTAGPAAYLLVAADLLVNHWPLSRDLAIPFLASPEVLCLDRALYVAERLPGIVGEDSIPRSTSVRSLIDLLEYYAVTGPPELRDRLVSLMRAASERLGPYGEQSSLNDPAFMAHHALNRLDRRNWNQATENPADSAESMEYVPPDVEARHLSRLQDESRAAIDAVNLQAAIIGAVEDAKQSSAELVTTAVQWARKVAVTEESRTLVTASALLLVRDSDDELLDNDEKWARRVFADVMGRELNPMHESADSLSYNPAGMAFVGMTHLLERSLSPIDIREVLDFATRDDSAAAPGFAATASTLQRIDERLPRAILRTAFASCILTRVSDLLVSAETCEDLGEKRRQRVLSVVEAELAWLRGERAEPVWSPFPRQEPRLNRGISISRDASSNRNQEFFPNPLPEEYVDHGRAALWLNGARSLFSDTARPWLRPMMEAYASWTLTANGSGRGKHDDVDVSVLAEWNNSYCRLLACCIPGMDVSEIDKSALVSLTGLPDSSFVSVTEQLVLHIDNLYFKRILPMRQAVHTRSILVGRLIKNDDWCQRDDQWMSIDVNLNRLVARMFLHDGWSLPARCYLHPDGVGQIEPLLLGLLRLAESGPCYFVALNLLEVDPRPSHLEFIVASTSAWLKALPDKSEFWVDQSVGRRICTLIGNLRLRDPSMLSRDDELRKRVDALLASLTSLGVVEAATLEQTLANADA